MAKLKKEKKEYKNFVKSESKYLLAWKLLKTKMILSFIICPIFIIFIILIFLNIYDDKTFFLFDFPLYIQILYFLLITIFSAMNIIKIIGLSMVVKNINNDYKENIINIDDMISYDDNSKNNEIKFVDKNDEVISNLLSKEIKKIKNNNEKNIDDLFD